MLCCVVLCCVVLCCVVLSCVVLCFVVLCCVVLCCVVLGCAVWCCVVLRGVVSRGVGLRCAVSSCAVLCLCCFGLCCVVLCCRVGARCSRAWLSGGAAFFSPFVFCCCSRRCRRASPWWRTHSAISHAGSTCAATIPPKSMLAIALFRGGRRRPALRLVRSTPCPNQRATIAFGPSIVLLWPSGKTRAKQAPQ